MTTSILNDVLQIRNDSPETLQNYLHEINLTIFDPIFHNSSNLEEAKQTIQYIIVAFSEDSPLVILRQDAQEEKNNVCEYLNIPEIFRGPLFSLVNAEVRKATTNYLEQFASQEFKTLMFMKIQLADMERDITNREFSTKKDEIYYYDIKEHGRAIQECRRLATEISKLESAIKNKIKYLGIENMQQWLSKGVRKNSTSTNGLFRGSGLEHSDLIK